MHPRISLITLGVSDLAASVAFYRDALGLPLHAASNADVAFFELNGTWLGLFPTAELAKDAGVANDGTGFRGVTLSHNLATEAEVDALFAELASKKVVIVKPPTKADWGGYHGYFRDPDGHLWEVAHNPFMWVGPK